MTILPGNLIKTDDYSRVLRARMFDAETRSILLTRFTDSAQSDDFRDAPNCGGFGRIHHFELEQFDDWPANPLPIRPAMRGLGLTPASGLPAQVFQNAGCNWRCWYCFVPYDDLTTRRGHLVPVRQMVDWTLDAHPEAHMVDLSGGQPDLTPEWAAWFVEELIGCGADNCYVWSDDNLSTDYLWRYLTPTQIGLLGEYPRYGRACCVKGFDAESFSFNTRAEPSLFDRQFVLLERLQRTTQIDFYVYLTITGPSTDGIAAKMKQLVDRLQSISEYLPLRSVPLKILPWGPAAARATPLTQMATDNQLAAIDAWNAEISWRFPGVPVDIEHVPR